MQMWCVSHLRICVCLSNKIDSPEITQSTVSYISLLRILTSSFICTNDSHTSRKVWVFFICMYHMYICIQGIHLIVSIRTKKYI